LLLSVVPGGPLGFLPVAFKDPVAELSAGGEDLSEEARINQSLQFEDARQEEFILYNPVLDTRLFRQPGKLNCLVDRFCRRFLAVNVFASCNSLPDARSAEVRQL